MKNFRESGFHYAWFILIGCCLIQGSVLGVVQNCRGIFYNAVCEDLGFKTSAFTLYSLFHGIGSFLTMPFSTRLIDRKAPRLMLTLFILIFCGSTMLLGCMNTLPGFYLVGFVQGMGGSPLLFYIAPLLVNNWFKKKYGLAIGISSSVAGLAGILANPLLNSVIETSGWRRGYLIQGLATLVLALIGTAFVRAVRPEQIGMCRFGEDSSSVPVLNDAAVSEAPATSREKKLLLLVIVFTLMTATLNSFGQHFAKYAVTVGLSSAVGALMVSCSMVSNITFKLILGMLNDRIGTKKTIYFGIAVVTAGFALMTVTVPSVLFAAAFLSGMCMPICGTCVPLLVKYMFGTKRYRKFYSKATMAITLGTSAAIFLISSLYELFGSYKTVFLMGVGLAALCTLLVAAAGRMVDAAKKV